MLARRAEARALIFAGAVALASLPLTAQAAETTGSLGEAAPKRYAIVIGNGDYAAAPDLRNARADAELVAGFLADQGYAVTRYADLDKAGFEAMLQRVLLEIDKDSEVVFYFAGHGVQIAGANYLIPIDAAFDDAYDLPFEAISLATIVDVLGARARTQIVILDSCRSNPFAGAVVLADVTGTPSEPRDGFNVLSAPVNSLLAFSTSPGTNAWDGADGNSPFTAALIEGARAAPERPIGQLLEEVRRQVYARTGGRQVPWESSTLVQSVAFGVPSAGFVLASGSDETGSRRSWMSPTMPQASVVNTAGANDVPIVMAARRDQEVGLGPTLVAALDLPPQTPVTISAPPESGRLLVDLKDGLRVDASLQTGLTAAALQTLAYEPQPELPPAIPAAGPTGLDSFTVTVDGEPELVELALELDPCDAAAGDHLDPEGVGPGRYPNEILAEAALPACQAAVESFPDVGRFHYQLGRVQLAVRDFDAAQASFARARDLGHTRAWVALGLLVATADARSGGRGESAAPQEAIDLYQQGVDRGDPYAMHTLGRELLRNGGDEAARRRGFELLQQALQFGHTFSMNELGYYYMDPDSPDADPARGLKYIQESAARNDIYGYYNLGLVYRDGLAGVERDIGAAVEWFEKSASGGHPAAPGTLGRLWNSGALGETDRFTHAIEWYDQGLARCDGWSGANAAWIIANRAPAGYTPRDAAVRAAKAAVLNGEDSAAQARDLLATLDRKAIDGAAQTLVNALGGSIEIDGAFGQASATEMEKVLAAAGLEAPEGTPTERLLALARAHWLGEPCRVDLY
jgi:TPR repeat protein